jgi:hypothetical protein
MQIQLKGNNMIRLELCKRTNPTYQEIRNRHYIPNSGCHGQQLHYIIFYNDKVCGIISGGSSVWAVKDRDAFFGLTKDNKQKGLPSIINNVVFRLELNEKNLGSKILSMWRKRIALDWEKKYKVKVHGFETFIIENDVRKGALYKADNWAYVGITAGSTKKHNGLENKSTRVSVVKKLIFCKKIKKTSLSTEYTPTWNLKSKKRCELAMHQNSLFPSPAQAQSLNPNNATMHKGGVKNKNYGLE